MRSPGWIVLLAMMTSGCHCHFGLPQATAEQRRTTEANVRRYMATVADDVTHQGPTAWQKHLVNDPAFFMANDGMLVFPNYETAYNVVDDFARATKSIELKWGDDLRVDPLTPTLAVVGATWHEVRVDTNDKRTDQSGFFTGVVEDRNGQWQFRDAHWSTSTPPPAQK
jgi:hypothetical protein